MTESERIEELRIVADVEAAQRRTNPAHGNVPYVCMKCRTQVSGTQGKTTGKYWPPDDWGHGLRSDEPSEPAGYRNGDLCGRCLRSLHVVFNKWLERPETAA